ncbi:branched-chain amino acid ABC transporter permease [Roseomonas sp. HJA6]|uniref:Branched-chain amino acid ABC transporter permease n=1 Tax=Roseomonas alba TaxID=2846776 RepID=A0ABS7ABD6_9PROT|nr:branched-chain amino acid ABC transporter permease [Neoroseomonas alba]MBW6399603.1 branched-chain amino acid ABC transporter permease [Neoroseomonas alba]
MSTSQNPLAATLAPVATPARDGVMLRILIVLGGFVAIAAVPIAFASSYQLFQLTLAATYAIAILGLNIVTGFNGQISLGHGAFYAVGAYTTAILMTHFDVPYWATLPIAAAICGVIGFGIGFPALRLGGLYLALTTFAVAVAVPQILKYKGVEDWTGGVQGTFLVKPDAPEFTGLDNDQYLYLFVLVIAALLFLMAANLLHSRIGRAMRSIRDNPIAAEAMGMDIARIKTRTFALSAAITGLAGALSAIAVEFVAPDSFSVELSINLFVGMVVGGVGSIVGPIFGGLFVVFVPNLAESIARAAPGVIYGVILILFLYLLPQGFAGFPRRIGALLRQRSQG